MSSPGSSSAEDSLAQLLARLRAEVAKGQAMYR